MPGIEGTLMPPSLKATGVTKKAQTHAAKPYPRNPQKLQTQDCVLLNLHAAARAILLKDG
jgi:hypothetical protein